MGISVGSWPDDLQAGSAAGTVAIPRALIVSAKSQWKFSLGSAGFVLREVTRVMIFRLGELIEQENAERALPLPPSHAKRPTSYTPTCSAAWILWKVELTTSPLWTFGVPSSTLANSFVTS